jgi:dTDP-4-dehydrorhamnose 3,5-epimerase
MSRCALWAVYLRRLDLMSIDFDTFPSLPLTIVPKRHADDRGWFSETFHHQRLRGLHFQVPPAAQAKLVGVLRGRILDVVADIRRDSPTFGKYVSVELSSDNGKQLFVPAGFAHGFVTLEDDVAVLYKTSDYYAPSREGGIRWNDPDIAFPWPFKEADIIRSEKDERLPLLKDLDSPFPYDGNPLTELPVFNLS